MRNIDNNQFPTNHFYYKQHCIAKLTLAFTAGLLNIFFMQVNSKKKIGCFKFSQSSKVTTSSIQMNEDQLCNELWFIMCCMSLCFPVPPTTLGCEKVLGGVGRDRRPSGHDPAPPETQ